LVSTPRFLDSDANGIFDAVMVGEDKAVLYIIGPSGREGGRRRR